MPGFDTSIEVRATPEEIWQVLSRVVEWNTWTPTIASVRALDGADLAVGRRFEVRQPKLRPAVWAVESVSPNEAFTWVMSAPGVTTVAKHEIETLQGSTSRVTLSVRFHGFLAPLVWLFAGKTTRDYVRTEAQSLKAKAEGRASTP